MGIPSRESNTSAMTNLSAQGEFCLFRPNCGRLGARLASLSRSAPEGQPGVDPDPVARPARSWSALGADGGKKALTRRGRIGLF